MTVVLTLAGHDWISTTVHDLHGTFSLYAPLRNGIEIVKTCIEEGQKLVTSSPGNDEEEERQE